MGRHTLLLSHYRGKDMQLQRIINVTLIINQQMHLHIFQLKHSFSSSSYSSSSINSTTLSVSRSVQKFYSTPIYPRPSPSNLQFSFSLGLLLLLILLLLLLLLLPLLLFTLQPWVGLGLFNSSIPLLSVLDLRPPTYSFHSL